MALIPGLEADGIQALGSEICPGHGGEHRPPTKQAAPSPNQGPQTSSGRMRQPARIAFQRSRYSCPTGLAVLPMMNIEYRPLEATAMSLALYDTPPLTVSWVLL